MPNLLLIEDDFSLGATLEENLKLEGYRVTKVDNGAEGLEQARHGGFDLIVLDVMLPQLSGFEVLSQLRTTSDTPVLMISAKGTPSDRIKGLELEADDYLAKPFHLKEFLLRIQRLLKRAEKQAAPLARTISIGQATFDLEGLTVTPASGQPEVLSSRESQFIKILIKNSGKVVSRDEVVHAVWGSHENPSTRTVDNLVVKLRRWIEKDPSHPHIIVSHRGIGYSLKLTKGESNHEFIS